MDLFNTYALQAVAEVIPPVASFFKDRYFPTGEDDIFNADKVLVEYMDGDNRIAPFVSARVGDIPVERTGYEVHEMAPAYIAPSRVISVDELRKRGFGEALYANSTAAQRAVKLQLKDFTDLDRRITRREEWMAVQTMINNACTIQTYIDGKTEGEKLDIKFYEGVSSKHKYTVSHTWNGESGDFFGDVEAMCEQLSQRGLAAEDLILGSDTAKAVLALPDVKERLNRNSGIITGTIDAKLTQYPGVVFMGQMNFSGYILNLFCVNEMYTDDTGVAKKYFPAKAAMVTAPACGHMMYGRIDQINHGETEFTSIAAVRVPKLVVDQENDIRKLRLGTRPLAAPRNSSPFVYAENAVD